MPKAKAKPKLTVGKIIYVRLRELGRTPSPGIVRAEIAVVRSVGEIVVRVTLLEEGVTTRADGSLRVWPRGASVHNHNFWEVDP